MKMKHWIAALFLMSALTCFAAPASQFGSVSLGWSYNFAASPGVIGFNIYYGTNLTALGSNWDGNTNQCQCYQFVQQTSGTNLTVTIPNLVRGATYYFGLTPYTATDEGPLCNEVRTAIANKPGKASALVIIGVQ